MSILPHQSAINLSDGFYFNPGSAVPDEDSVLVNADGGLSFQFLPTQLTKTLNASPIIYVAPDDGVLVVTASASFLFGGAGNNFKLTVTDGVYTNFGETVNSSGLTVRTVGVVFTRPVAKNESVTINIIASAQSATASPTVSSSYWQVFFSPNP